MKVSIIVPIYNAEKFLNRMLNSLIFQTFQDFEVIMINDGSTDSSGKICNNYAAIDKRFKVIHKENGGVATARQIGINNAQGEYSIHCDADDWVDPTMLEDMVEYAENTHADIVVADYFSDNNMIVIQEPTSLEAKQLLQDIFVGRVFGALWNKLLRTEIYHKYNAIFFKDVYYCEDVLIWTQILQHTDIIIAYLNKAYYHYQININSITRNFTRKTFETRCAFYKKLIYILPQTEFQKEKRNVRLGVLAEGFMNNVIENKEVWQELIKYNKRAAFIETKSIRWRIGYLCIALGIFSLARKILHY